MTNKFSPEVADKLLDKLSSDDDFRALFQSNPRAALAQVGHETPAHLVGVRGSDPLMCSNTPVLASKEAIQASREALKTSLTSTMAQAVFAV